MYLNMLLVLILLITVCVVKLKEIYSYWRRKGIKGPTPVPLFGSFINLVLSKPFHLHLKSIYDQYPDEKVVGLYKGFNPALLVRDPVIAKHILIKDFNNFVDRGFDTRKGGHGKNLFGADGDTWRILRQKLTPTFTSKKIKAMIPLIQKCDKQFTDYVTNIINEDGDLKIKSLMCKFTLDIISTCAFGLDLNLYTNSSNEFFDMANLITNPPLKIKLLQLGDFLMPGFRDMFSYFDHTETRSFFKNLVTSVIKERGGKIKTRHDFIDLLMELKEEGHVRRRDGKGEKEIVVDDDLIEAQVIVFYVAGFESSSSLLSFLLHELALHPEIQERAYEEICNVSTKFNGEVTFESVQEMSFLHMVICETIRQHSVTCWLMRKANIDCNIPDVNTTIKKGTTVLISMTGFHGDPKYFTNPDRFNPDNFSTENIKKLQQCVFMPFGAGPRNCIAMRFADVVVKIGAASFIKKFKVVPSNRTSSKLSMDPRAQAPTSAAEGIWLKILKRE